MKTLLKPGDKVKLRDDLKEWVTNNLNELSSTIIDGLITRMNDIETRVENLENQLKNQ